MTPSPKTGMRTIERAQYVAVVAPPDRLPGSGDKSGLDLSIQ